jgi:hypothetical protein
MHRLSSRDAADGKRLSDTNSSSKTTCESSRSAKCAMRVLHPGLCHTVDGRTVGCRGRAGSCLFHYQMLLCRNKPLFMLTTRHTNASFISVQCVLQSSLRATTSSRTIATLTIVQHASWTLYCIRSSIMSMYCTPLAGSLNGLS